MFTDIHDQNMFIPHQALKPCVHWYWYMEESIFDEELGCLDIYPVENTQVSLYWMSIISSMRLEWKFTPAIITSVNFMLWTGRNGRILFASLIRIILSKNLKNFYGCTPFQWHQHQLPVIYHPVTCRLEANIKKVCPVFWLNLNKNNYWRTKAGALTNFPQLHP